LAIASLVLGTIGCFPLAIIFGCIALYLAKKQGYAVAVWLSQA
jgi:hypothetical protein